MALPDINLEQFMALNPCYPRAEVERVAAGREKMNALEILAVEEVPVDHRLAAILRSELLPAEVLRVLACDFADHVAPLWDEVFPQPVPRQAISVKRRWLARQASDAELLEVRKGALEVSGRAHRSASASSGPVGARAAARVAYAAYWAAAATCMPPEDAHIAVRAGYAAAKAKELAADSAMAFTDERSWQAAWVQDKLIRFA